MTVRTAVRVVALLALVLLTNACGQSAAPTTTTTGAPDGHDVTTRPRPVGVRAGGRWPSSRRGGPEIKKTMEQLSEPAALAEADEPQRSYLRGLGARAVRRRRRNGLLQLDLGRRNPGDRSPQHRGAPPGYELQDARLLGVRTAGDSSAKVRKRHTGGRASAAVKAVDRSCSGTGIENSKHAPPSNSDVR